MASAFGYAYWRDHGRPYALMRPAKALQRTLQGHGLTVYDYPNAAHLQANTPEDHTPFSVTGWPRASGYGIGHALDVMPRNDSDAARRENANVARQLIQDRDAGVPGVMWVKYINWTDERGNCQQVRWMDDDHPLTHTTRSSSDRGHIHISGRSDCDDDDRAGGYDPIGGDVNLSESNPFGTTPKQFIDPAKDYPLWLGGTLGNQLQYIRETSYFGWLAARTAAAKVEALTTVIEALAAALKAGGGSVDTTAILAGVDERLAKLAAEQRDAVADLGEGGAAQVRGPQA